MNRLQKKCVIASAGGHSLLALLLVVGPAFLSPSSKTMDVPVLDFVPLKTVDALMSGGGNPNARPQAATPTPPITPVSVPAPSEPSTPVTPRETVHDTAPPETKEESLEVADKPRKPKISTTLVPRKRDLSAEAKARADAQAKEEAREYADARRRAVNALGQAAATIGNEVSGGTSIELKGPGGGGVPYANFLQAVKTVYENAWIVPDGVADDDATTAVSVTIARDGTVISSHITRSSGNPDVDRSVQRTLERVRYAAPLPDDAKENQRTVSINFNVRAKRALG